MSGGGGEADNTIEDTPEQRYAAKVAAEKWNFAQEKLAPLENEYMARVGELDSAGRMSYLRGVTSQSSQAQLSQGLQGVSTQLNEAGINPNSGRYSGTLTDLTQESALQGGETMGRAQFQQASEKIKGMQNIVAIGSGQSGQAQAGLSDIASQSAADARQESSNSFNRRSANLQLLGGIAGAATNFGLSKLNTGSGSAGLNMQGQEQPLTSNAAYVRNM